MVCVSRLLSVFVGYDDPKMVIASYLVITAIILCIIIGIARIIKHFKETTDDSKTVSRLYHK